MGEITVPGRKAVRSDDEMPTMASRTDGGAPTMASSSNIVKDEHFESVRLNRAQRRAKESIERKRRRAMAKGKPAPHPVIVSHDPNARAGGAKR